MGTALHYVEPELRNKESLTHITKVDIQPEGEYWSTTAYCSLLGENPPFAVMNDYFRRIWSGHGIDKVIQMEKSLYVIRFQTKEDKDLGLVKECLQFDNKPTLMQE